MSAKDVRRTARLGIEVVESRLVLSPSVPTIDVSYSGTTLTITGDNLDDNFRVREVAVGGVNSPTHALMISSGDHGNTRVISSDKSVTVLHGQIVLPDTDVVDTLNIALGSGDNTVFVSRLDTFGTAAVNISDGGAAGNNTITISGDKKAATNYALSVNLGTGNDMVSVGASNLASLAISLNSLATTKDNVQLNGDNVAGATTISTGAGRDHFRIGGDNFTTPHGVYSGPVTVSLGAGDDLGYINTVTFNSTLSIDGGTGDNLVLGFAHMPASKLTVTNATNHIIVF